LTTTNAQTPKLDAETLYRQRNKARGEAAHWRHLADKYACTIAELSGAMLAAVRRLEMYEPISKHRYLHRMAYPGKTP